MEQIIQNRKYSPLRKTFYGYVLLTFLLIVALSSMVIICCGKIQNWLLPENKECYLTIEKTYANGTTESTSHLMEFGKDVQSLPILIANEDNAADSPNTVKYSVKPYGKDPSLLTSKKQLLYRFCSVATIAMPMIFSLIGILLCGMLFYKNHLSKPIAVLTSGAEHIANQNLDFKISSHQNDELGELCSSFEMMRRSLAENNQKMWKMVEDRKNLQASIAHDLRNPITIIKGYAEYLKINIPTGEVDNDKTMEIAGKIEKAANRMESYTESVRTINHLEELTPNKKDISIQEYIDDLSFDMNRLCRAKGISFTVRNELLCKTVTTDADMLSRIIENIVSNSLRYAKSSIAVHLSQTGETYTVELFDDGCGFSKEVLLQNRDKQCFGQSEDGHLGMGLYLCEILCRKLDGTMTISNYENGGAIVKLTFPFEK